MSKETPGNSASNQEPENKGNAGTIRLSTLKLNPNNPRLIKDEKFKKLVKSIKDLPKMMRLRPLIIDDNNIIKGGNMRYRALKELGYKEVDPEWVKKASDFTEKELKEFVIKDNLSFGENDYEMLANEYEMQDLIDYGYEEWELGLGSEPDESEGNNEINIADLGNKSILKLEFDNEVYLDLIGRLNAVKKENQTNEDLFLLMLERYESAV